MASRTDKNYSICGIIGGLYSGSIPVYYVAKFWENAPNLPTPLYFVPNNLQIYLGQRLDPPTYVGTNSQILPFFLRHPLACDVSLSPSKQGESPSSLPESEGGCKFAQLEIIHCGIISEPTRIAPQLSKDNKQLSSKITFERKAVSG